MSEANMGPFYFDRCMTVKELKEIIKDWPEYDQYGEPSEVWMETGQGLSSPVVCAIQLNSTDIEFASAAFDEDEPAETVVDNVEYRHVEVGLRLLN